MGHLQAQGYAFHFHKLRFLLFAVSRWKRTAKGIATISEAQVFHDGQDNIEYLIYAGAFLILAKDENRYHRRRIA